MAHPEPVSVQAVAWVYDHAPASLSPAEHAVLVALAWRADPDGERAFPAIAEIVRMTRLSEPTVYRALRGLRVAGVIAVAEPATNRRPATYRIPGARGVTTTPQPDARPITMTPQGYHHDTPRGITMTPEKTVEKTIEKTAAVAAAPAPTRTTPKRIPDDWTMTPELREYAIDHGIAERDVDDFGEEFRLYWISTGKPRANWDATFQGRVRDQAQRRRANGPAVNGRVDAADPDMAAWLRVVEFLEAKRETGEFPGKVTKAINHAVDAIGGWGNIDPAHSYQRRDFLAAHKAERLKP